MSIHVKLSTTLRKYVPGYDPEQGLELDIGEQEHLMAKDIVIRLGLPLPEIKFLMLNGRYRDLDAFLNPGDRLAFFPAVGGG